MSTSTPALVRRSGTTRLQRAVAVAVLTSFFATSSLPSYAALTDLASAPLASTTSAQVKPNIMFILDTSGSMAWDFMPDNVDDSSGRDKIGFRNHLCNIIYYNPAINYAPPKKPDGTNFPDAPFTGAFTNGFQNYPGTPTSTTNLSTSFPSYAGDSSHTQGAYYWTYTGSQTLVPSTTGACRNTDSYPAAGTSVAASGGGTWVKVRVSSTSGPGSTDETQNFANWYSYYRTRILAMKSAASRAFNQLTDSYRMGLVIINPGSSVSSTEYLAINDFDTAQKDAWYAKLFGMTTGNSTPLREALARVGRHYAGQTDGINSGMTPDPVQYSCQQNFAILTTDGYWNTGDESAGPVKIDGSTLVGRQDGDLSITPRPLWDGGISGTTATTDKENLYTTAACTLTTPQMRTLQYQEKTVQNQQRTASATVTYTQLQRCPSSKWNYGSGTCSSESYWADRHNNSCSSRCREDPVPRTTSVSSCPSGSYPKSRNSNGETYTGCAASSWSAWSNVNTCTPSASVECQVASDSGWVNAGSCTPSNSGSGPTITCQTTSDTGWVDVASCTPSSPAGGPSVICQSASTGTGGLKIQYQTTTYTTTTATSGGVQIGTPTTSTSTSSTTDFDGVCYPSGSLPSLPPNPDPAVPGTEMNPQRPVPPANAPAPPSGCAAWPCTTTSSSTSGGSSNSLADVAQYYYNTDLRPTMTDNVPSSGQGVEDDKASWQHMTTFTLGLGLSGNLTYRPDYKTATTGDFAGLRTGSISWPVAAGNSPQAIDDLWHTAVNGRGQYFSAGDPDSVVSGLQTALAGINARVASAAAAATSNLEPVAGDNFAYTAQYTTQKWTGELEAHQIDLSTGAVLPTVIWSAQTLLDPKVKDACDDRTIYLFHAGATNNRVNFTWDTKACDASGLPTGTADTGLDTTEKAYFDSTRVALLSQWPTMTDGASGTDDQRGAAPGANLVNFLRGQKGKEGFVADDIDALYRTREHALGDIVSAQPVYIKAPFASYSEADNAGYGSFKSDKSSRTQMVYVAANDGMLHGFDAATGDEAWAFIPGMVLPNLYKLADNNYANTHVYSVDGTPSAGDVYDTTAAEWKTVLVAGLNGGGKGYYALDVTDPASPKGLWEFKWSSTCNPVTLTSIPLPAGAKSDCHLGYTYSNPLITKLASGQWVVIVASGYNNVSGNLGDGQGYLYVLDAITGDIIYKISNGTGNSTTPSGLNHIVNWVDDTTTDNTTLRVYGGDLLGNVWRFDVNDSLLPAGVEATLVGTAKDPGGTPQPITTRPELAEVGGNPMVFVATGRMLGASDLTDAQVQSIWGIIDPLGPTTAYADLRAALKPLEMTQVGSGSAATRTIECTGTTSECNSTSGWVVDLPDSGERVSVDMRLQLGTIVVASNVPQNTACNIGGYSWLNFLNFSTGTAVSNAPGNIVSQMLSDSLAVGLNIVRLPNGQTVVITTTSDAKQTTISAPFSVPTPVGRRISWREISQ